ncbi:MAG: hypothetical protein R2769_04000 [Saprospiraceae bacterium]
MSTTAYTFNTCKFVNRAFPKKGTTNNVVYYNPNNNKARINIQADVEVDLSFG